jgi:hypothetical protein
MRAEGALLVSAVRKAGKTKSVRIVSEMGGRVVLADPFAGGKFTSRGKRVTMLPARGGMIEFTAVPGAEVEFVSQ